MATSRHFTPGRARLFAPIYVGNVCSNDCLYCGYRRSNKALPRTWLNSQEAALEAATLVSRGVHRVLVLCGEVPEHLYIDRFAACVDAIRRTPGIEWLGVEVAPISSSSCKRLLDAGADAFIVFQESYDRNVYGSVHPRGDLKADFDHRRESLAVAVSAGFREVGLGVLYGLADPTEETDHMIAHARELSSSSVSVRLSFPRLRPSLGAALKGPLREVSEIELAHSIVHSRLSLPKAGIALTARESLSFRTSLLGIATEFGAGGSTTVGGYASRPASEHTEQFLLLDRNPASHFISVAAQHGFQVR